MLIVGASVVIDPVKITNFNLNKNQLEEVLLFWVCASGKNGVTSARCLENFLSDLHKQFQLQTYQPFKVIRKWVDMFGLSELAFQMRKHGIGCYNLKAYTFKCLAFSGLNLSTCTVDDLEKIKGIGCKTSRCFIIHSRKNARHAGLDTHIKKYLRDNGYDVPKNLTKKQYEYWEDIFLKLADRFKIEVAKFDLMIWNHYSGNLDVKIPFI